MVTGIECVGPKMYPVKKEVKTQTMKLSKRHLDLLQQAADVADGREYSPEGRFVTHLTDDKAGVEWLAKRGYLKADRDYGYLQCKGVSYEITGEGCEVLQAQTDKSNRCPTCGR